MFRPLVAVVALAAGTAAGAAQYGAVTASPEQAYDGKFTMVRLRWGSDLGGGFGRRGFSAAWNHDYPRAEAHLARIAKDLTTIDVRVDGSLILALDDPALFKYPVAFMWEPGFWNLTDTEAVAFRAYLQKGGFAIFEDFDGPQQWSVFESQMRRVLPNGRFVRLGKEHRIFDSFFTVKDPDALVHPMIGIKPSYYGIYEDNDPRKRLMVVANFDNDVPEYWEWSGEGFYSVDVSNEAYKLGINYLIYGLTH